MQQIKRHLFSLPFAQALKKFIMQGGGLGGLNARVYAVKANYNCLLDVARETFKENVGDIFQLSRELSDQHELPIQLVYQDNGFVFTLKKSDLEDGGKVELPRGFVNITSRKGKWVFETMELVCAPFPSFYHYLSMLKLVLRRSEMQE